MEILKIKYFLFIFFLIINVQYSHANFLFTGDIDLRYKNLDFKEHEIYLNTIGISLRKTFADKMGDRITLFLLAKSMHNFKENMIDQSYAQYKGPLGKWNITLGRYRLPYGLLPNYSTTRLLITTLENEMIGFASDNGLQLSGTLDDMDYAISLSQGIGQKFKPIDFKNNGLISFRLGYQGLDFEDLRIGFSGLIGEIIIETQDGDNTLNKQLFALDLIKYTGPLIMRGEFSLGEENNKTLLGLFLGVDYAILPKIDINFGYKLAKLAEYKKIQQLSTGLTFNIFTSFQIRIAHKFPISVEGKPNEFFVQLYYIYSSIF